MPLKGGFTKARMQTDAGRELFLLKPRRRCSLRKGLKSRRRRSAKATSRRPPRRGTKYVSSNSTTQSPRQGGRRRVVLAGKISHSEVWECSVCHSHKRLCVESLKHTPQHDPLHPFTARRSKGTASLPPRLHRLQVRVGYSQSLAALLLLQPCRMHFFHNHP